MLAFSGVEGYPRRLYICMTAVILDIVWIRLQDKNCIIKAGLTA
jgi:hypothetical protein